MANPIPLTIVVGALPLGFSGGPQQLSNAMGLSWQIFLPNTVSTFQSGSILPTSDVGPFWFTGVNPPQWYGWNTVTGSYVPLFVIPTTWVVGMQMNWQGSILDITNILNPLGWFLSDGSTNNGFTTVDLRDKFLVGAGSTYPVAGTGGSTTLASHNHTLPAATAGHTLVQGELPSTLSNVTINQTNGGSGGGAASTLYPNVNPGSGTLSIPANITGVGSDIAHSHDLGGNTGNATGLAILPPYYASCVIVFCGTGL